MGMPDLVATVMERSVTITDRFEGFHRWKDAPEDVKFLRDYHRHLFGVRVTIDVTHGDRQVEFFQAKRVLSSLLKKYTKVYLDMSCEMIAEEVGEAMAYNGYYVSEVSVDEDGENAGTVTFDTVRRMSGQERTPAAQKVFDTTYAKPEPMEDPPFDTTENQQVIVPEEHPLKGHPGI